MKLNIGNIRKMDEISLKKAWEAELKAKLLSELQELSKSYSLEKSQLLQEKSLLENLLNEEHQKVSILHETQVINSMKTAQHFFLILKTQIFFF